VILTTHQELPAAALRKIRLSGEWQ